MSDEKQQPAAAEPAKGFGNLRCCECGEVGNISLDLDDLKTFNCPECDANFNREAVEEFITEADTWRSVLLWLDR